MTAGEVKILQQAMPCLIAIRDRNYLEWTRQNQQALRNVIVMLNRILRRSSDAR